MPGGTAGGGRPARQRVANAAADWDGGVARLAVLCGKGQLGSVVPRPSWVAERIRDCFDKHPDNGRLLRTIDWWRDLGERLSPQA
jgi:hypothetical protein